MSTKLDAYEVIGVVMPGSVLLFGVTLQFPGLQSLFMQQGFSLGDLGLFLVLSFVAGHLVQAVGNILEGVVWRPFGGMPTEWVLRDAEKLLHTTQVERLVDSVETEFGCDIRKMSRKQWLSIIREIYVVDQTNGDTTRIDSFNRTYGLMRGITAALIVLSVTSLIVAWPEWKPAFLTAAAAVVSGYRMVRFGIRYGRELFVVYVRVMRPSVP